MSSTSAFILAVVVGGIGLGHPNDEVVYNDIWFHHQSYHESAEKRAGKSIFAREEDI